jgi:hypothetical protein
MAIPQSVFMARGPLRLFLVFVTGWCPIAIAAMTTVSPVPTVSEGMHGKESENYDDPEPVLL